MRRVIGMDIHRTFAEVVFWEDGKLRAGGRIGMTRAGLEGFGRSLGKKDEIVIEATCNAMAVVRVLSPIAIMRTAPAASKPAATFRKRGSGSRIAARGFMRRASKSFSEGSSTYASERAGILPPFSATQIRARVLFAARANRDTIALVVSLAKAGPRGTATSPAPGVPALAGKAILTWD